MKILINYLGKSNGGPVTAFAISKSLSEIGNEVYVLLSKNICNKEQWDEYSGFKKVVYIDTYTNKSSFILNTIKFWFNKKKVLCKNFSGISFDMIFNPQHHMWSTMVCKCFKNVLIVSISHDPIAHEGESKIETFVTAHLMKISDYIIVLTKKFIPIIKEKYKKPDQNILYMPHGVSDMYKRVNIKKNIYENDNNWHFLFFGRIEEYKGVDILVDAFLKLEKECNNIDLYIVGKGVIKNENLSESKNIHIINEYIDDKDVGNFFDNERVIVVLPYISASQSGVIAVALLYGNVIIASDVGGLKEQLGDGKAGIFTQPGNADELYRKMKEVIYNNALFSEQKNNIELIAKQMDWKYLLENVMKDICDDNE